MDKKFDLARISDVILAAHADVVGLQEVDRNTKRSNGVDEIAELERLTGMKGVFGKSIDLPGGEYGIAILVKGQILESFHEKHPVGKESERRSYLIAKVRLESGAVMRIANTHLGLNREDRKAQAAALLQAASAIKEPLVIVGDLNEEPNEKNGGVHPALSASFTDCWAEFASQDAKQNPDRAANPLYGSTFPADHPKVRIDYIWARGGDGWKTMRSWIPQTQASDHAPLFAELSLGN